MRFYVYLWLREDGTPYYVGKGCGQRAYKCHRTVFSPPPKERIVIIPCATEAEAFAQEVILIDLYGRKDDGTGVLRNLTDGGENPPSHQGRKRTAGTLAKMSQAQTGHSRNLGSKRSEETKGKMRAAHIGKTKGMPWTAARRAAGQPHRTPEDRIHLSEVMTKIRSVKKWSGHPSVAA